MENNLLLTVPLLHVLDMPAALAFYCGKLGFNKNSMFQPYPDRDNPSYVTLQRDAAGLHISSFAGDAKPGGVAVIFVRDVDLLFAEFRDKGVDVGDAPVDQTWGNREFYFRDMDGNQLRFAQPPLE